MTTAPAIPMVEVRAGVVAGRFTVGVAELAGLEPVRRFLDIPHLEQMLARFEAAGRRVLSPRPGVLVRTRAGGAGVVYTAAAADAVNLARELVDAAAADDLLPPVRVGIASGAVLVTPDRCYGPAVDAATRHMAAAAPGSVRT